MKIEKFTIKLQEALQEAVNYARDYNQQQVEPEHLILALIRQEDGIVPSVFDRLGLPTYRVIKVIEEDLKAKPAVHGSNTQPYLSGRMNRVLIDAEKEARALKDEFVSGEHVLIAMLADEGSVVTKELRKAGVGRDGLLSALAEVRGSHRITD